MALCSMNEKKDNFIWPNDFSVLNYSNLISLSMWYFCSQLMVQKCTHLRFSIVVLDIVFDKSVFSSCLSRNHFYQTCHTGPCKTITLEVIFHYYIHVNIINIIYILLLFRIKLIRMKCSSFIILESSHRKTITVQDTNGYNFQIRQKNT